MQLSTPCGALALRPRGNHGVARLAAERPWLDQAAAMKGRLAAVRHSALPPIVSCGLVDDVLEVVYAPRPSAQPLVDRTNVVEILLAASDVADAVSVLWSLPGGPVGCGPLAPELMLGDSEGGQLIGAGLWAAAYGLDRTRRQAMSERHFIESPESVAGLVLTERTDSFHLG